MVNKFDKPDNIFTLQYLRALAAFAVAISHLSYGQSLFFQNAPEFIEPFIGVWGGRHIFCSEWLHYGLYHG